MTGFGKRFWAVFTLLAVLAGGLGAAHARLDYSVEVGAELRTFPNDPAFSDQDDTTFSPSAFLKPEFLYEWEDSRTTLAVEVFARADLDDDERTHIDIREASILHDGGSWSIVAGISKVFWGVTESRHLVDIINQDDFVEDIDGEDKLGQPMVNIGLSIGVGTLDLFYLPYFRERTFPDGPARLRGPVPIIADQSVFESPAEQWTQSFAGRWSASVGAFDIGLAHFHGTSREPRFTPVFVSATNVVLLPVYDQIDQSSADLQFTQDATLWKVEALTRAGQGKRFAAVVAGLEHTLYQVFGTAADVGLLAEYLYDGRDEARAPPIFQNNDVFAGARLTLNDAQDTAVLVGAIVDAEDGSTFVSAEAERRIGDDWKVELEARFFVNFDPREFETALAEDDFVTLRLTKYI